jgi:hypothetical protein
MSYLRELRRALQLKVQRVFFKGSTKRQLQEQVDIHRCAAARTGHVTVTFARPRSGGWWRHGRSGCVPRTTPPPAGCSCTPACTRSSSWLGS